MKILIILFTLTICVLFLPSSSNAQGAVRQYFDDWNSIIGIKDEPAATDLTTIPGIINALVPLIIVLSGLILLLMLIAGGFQMLTSAGNPEGAEAGKKRLTTSLIGFVVIFVAYWLIQIMEVILGVNIFGHP